MLERYLSWKTIGYHWMQWSVLTAFGVASATKWCHTSVAYYSMSQTIIMLFLIRWQEKPLETEFTSLAIGQIFTNLLLPAPGTWYHVLHPLAPVRPYHREKDIYIKNITFSRKVNTQLLQLCHLFPIFNPFKVIMRMPSISIISIILRK